MQPEKFFREKSEGAITCSAEHIAPTRKASEANAFLNGRKAHFLVSQKLRNEVLAKAQRKTFFALTVILFIFCFRQGHEKFSSGKFFGFATLDEEAKNKFKVVKGKKNLFS